MVILNRFCSDDTNRPIPWIVPLTAEERTRSRQRLEVQGQPLLDLQLPRGTVLKEGQILQSEDGQVVVKITAQPEPVMTVTASHALDLLRAAYHLGNRHIALEIAPHYLRFSPDPVLAKMLEQLGVQVKAEVCPFYPESGAYGNSHAH